MRSLQRLVAAAQREWPLLASLSLFVPAEPPAWAVASAQRSIMQFDTREVLHCRSQLPRLAANLAWLYRQYLVAMVLASLLAVTVMLQALATPLTDVTLAVLVSVLCAILLPPIIICQGIARDYVATKALLAALRALSAQSA